MTEDLLTSTNMVIRAKGNQAETRPAEIAQSELTCILPEVSSKQEGRVALSCIYAGGEKALHPIT